MKCSLSFRVHGTSMKELIEMADMEFKRLCGQEYSLPENTKFTISADENDYEGKIFLWEAEVEAHINPIEKYLT